MVDLQLTNEKLVQRAHRIVMSITGVEYARATEVLQGAGGSVKVAIVMAAFACSDIEARLLLDQHHGSVRAVLESTI
jgi:N-acetylmuramic acid 6-phosphate etherase